MKSEFCTEVFFVDCGVVVDSCQMLKPTIVRFLTYISLLLKGKIQRLWRQDKD